MATADPHGVILDARGRVMFHCATCGGALRADDFFDLGLRLPDAGECKDEYCEAELIDSIVHAGCLRRQGARAG